MNKKINFEVLDKLKYSDLNKPNFSCFVFNEASIRNDSSLENFATIYCPLEFEKDAAKKVFADIEVNINDYKTFRLNDDPTNRSLINCKYSYRYYFCKEENLPEVDLVVKTLSELDEHKYQAATPKFTHFYDAAHRKPKERKEKINMWLDTENSYIVLDANDDEMRCFESIVDATKQKCLINKERIMSRNRH